MRVNVYAEEMTDKIEIISKEIEGQKFTGLRFYLELPATVNGQQYQGPFMHHPGDDDSSAVTFWGKQDLRLQLQHAIEKLDEHYGYTNDQVYFKSYVKRRMIEMGVPDVNDGPDACFDWLHEQLKEAQRRGIPPQIFKPGERQEFQGYGQTTSHGTTVGVQRMVGGDAIRISAYNPALDSSDRHSELFFSLEATQALRNCLDLVLPLPKAELSVSMWSTQLAGSEGVYRIANERARQINVEGYTLDEDRSYSQPSLAWAALCYARPEHGEARKHAPREWPWDPKWWKPGDGSRAGRIRELEKAGALIAAEIDRLLALES